MNSSFLALLLTANLLACPVRCLSCETKVAAVQECSPAACPCCPQRDLAPVSEAPEPCQDECNCQDCVCDGAVIEGTLELPDPDLVIRWELPMLLAAYSVAGHGDFSTRRLHSLGGQLLRGRDRCITHQSWLI